MTGNVILKSFPNGIRIRLSDEPSFEQILRETGESFADAAAFFKDASVALQLLAYYVSSDKGFDVDKPRNLAKVVTVE